MNYLQNKPEISCNLFLQAGITSEEEHNNAKHILLEMGEFFQIQVTTFSFYAK